MFVQQAQSLGFDLQHQCGGIDLQCGPTARSWEKEDQRLKVIQFCCDQTLLKQNKTKSQPKPKLHPLHQDLIQVPLPGVPAPALYLPISQEPLRTWSSGRLLCVGNGNQSPTPSPRRHPPDYFLGHSSASQWCRCSVPLLLINQLVRAVQWGCWIGLLLG